MLSPPSNSALPPGSNRNKELRFFPWLLETSNLALLAKLFGSVAPKSRPPKKRAGSGSEPALLVREDYCGDVALAIG